MTCAVYYSNHQNLTQLLRLITHGESCLAAMGFGTGNAAVYSSESLHTFLQKEHQYDVQHLTQDQRSLASLSEGEQKQALLDFLLASKPDYLIVQNVFDNLDVAKKKALEQRLQQLTIPVLQLLNRRRDLLPFIDDCFGFDGKAISREAWPHKAPEIEFVGEIPSPISPMAKLDNLLISLRGVSLSYDERPILDNIHWDICQGELWQLLGANGSGKSTLLQLINGDNPKAYGQEIYLFGRKKGTGESVWDIKKHIGYFTKAMVQNFKSHDTVESMMLSGFFDSVGLYTAPSKQQRAVVLQWLSLVGLQGQAKEKFASLNLGSQRLVLVLRAMVKQPPLLLLDEPTVGLDDKEAARFVALVNLLAKAKTSAIIFVAHRAEEGLQPAATFQLTATEHGSVGKVTSFAG